jgi:hypothetical protein
VPPSNPGSPPTAPYSLAPTRFRFPALAALAGRAPLGGKREVALATYLVARLAQDAIPDRALPQVARAERAGSAKGWLATITLPAAVRTSLARAIEASSGDPASLATGLRAVMAVTATHLDLGARSELSQLAAALAAVVDAQALEG